MSFFGRITFFNEAKKYGFVTANVKQSPHELPAQVQFFFHVINFQKDAKPILGAYVVFELGAPIAIGKRVQAVKVRPATGNEIGRMSLTEPEILSAGGVQ